MNRDENERLCRTGPESAMGRMFREYWWPVLRSDRIEADGPPEKIRLLGEDFVAFRDTLGRVGILDEHCPHRGVSLALGRNEDCGLRCIMHGWKLDTDGVVVDTPNGRPRSRPQEREAGYPAREAAGIIWVWPNKGTPAAFPRFPFNDLPVGAQVNAVVGKMDCNWLQPLETLSVASL